MISSGCTFTNTMLFYYRQSYLFSLSLFPYVQFSLCPNNLLLWTPPPVVDTPTSSSRKMSDPVNVQIDPLHLNNVLPYPPHQSTTIPFLKDTGPSTRTLDGLLHKGWRPFKGETGPTCFATLQLFYRVEPDCYRHCFQGCFGPLYFWINRDPLSPFRSTFSIESSLWITIPPQTVHLFTSSHRFRLLVEYVLVSSYPFIPISPLITL